MEPPPSEVPTYHSGRQRFQNFTKMSRVIFWAGNFPKTNPPIWGGSICHYIAVRFWVCLINLDAQRGLFYLTIFLPTVSIYVTIHHIHLSTYYIYNIHYIHIYFSIFLSTHLPCHVFGRSSQKLTPKKLTPKPPRICLATMLRTKTPNIFSQVVVSLMVMNIIPWDPNP